MASNINPSLTPTNSLANFRFWCQKVLPLVYDDSLSYYEVLGKMVVQLNDVIDNVNADTDNVLTLKDAFLELQDYVNNFFDDIDQLASYAERAETAQTAANQSAISAASSASNASASSLAAMNAKDAAVAARQAAETSANTASTAATNANTKASEAAQSAITAQTAQASASQSATLAATDRSAAQTAASTATTKANEASTSATNAEASATNAEESKDEAETLVNSVRESLDNIQQNTADIGELKEEIGDSKILTKPYDLTEYIYKMFYKWKDDVAVSVSGIETHLYVNVLDFPDNTNSNSTYYTINILGATESNPAWTTGNFTPSADNEYVWIPADIFKRIKLALTCEYSNKHLAGANQPPQIRIAYKDINDAITYNGDNLAQDTTGKFTLPINVTDDTTHVAFLFRSRVRGCTCGIYRFGFEIYEPSANTSALALALENS